MSATRERALQLYKLLMRTSRTWSGKASEKEYIRSESRKQFKAHKTLSDPALIEQQLFDAQTRLELALHYKNPYPRVHNIIKTTPQRLNQHGLEEIKRQQIAKAQALFDT